ncbi:hypothetical protein [Erythrobacter sp. SD-21]|uniref:hypothetical protein n=1 Tax=Erythrobacter sp. SD-21 TaxID=161528 RepID=UPI000153FC2C|nr:hypothetical protein [Erythrobacter sp. SD-21]EDL49161.1 hypothetical protein ED21_20814 [Erythrobacter sp. SD-21]
MSRSALLLLPLLLPLIAACRPASQGSGDEPVAQARPSAPAPAVQLAGAWRVAGIDDEPFDRSYAIALVADETNIWWQPECALQYREYSISGSRFAAPTRPNANIEVCDIGYPEELDQIWSALEAADTIERTPENGVLIHGNGRSLLLFSQ